MNAALSTRCVHVKLFGKKFNLKGDDLLPPSGHKGCSKLSIFIWRLQHFIFCLPCSFFVFWVINELGQGAV